MAKKNVSKVAEVEVVETAAAEVVQAVKVQEVPQVLKESTGTLMLRMFTKDARTNKILTRLHRKVYFPENPNLTPGWYVTTITEIHDNFGIMDTMAMDTIPVDMWKPEYIKGIFIKHNFTENCLEIYTSGKGGFNGINYKQNSEEQSTNN